MTRPEPTQHEIDLSVWSDLHKDVYGFRPRGPAPADLDAEFTRLQAELDVVMLRERREKIAAAKVVKARLRKMMREHGITGLAALRFDYEALECDYGWEQYAFETGVSFGFAYILDRRDVKNPTYLARLREAAEDMSWDNC